MHGCSSGSAFLVNAEVDSMGGVLDGGVGIGTKASPRRAAIEKAQSDLRQEFDVRDDRRRELEFLEKGGNPLDFKLGQAASVSVQSTSHTDQHPEQIVTSAAKGSFPSTASPPGDSIESSGRPRGPTVFEPNSADNLLLFDGDNELLEGKRNSTRPSRRSSIAPPEQSSQIDGSQNAKESEDSAIFRPYARRNRSRSIRDGARSNSTDIVPSRGGLGSSLPARQGSRDTRGSISETNNQKDQDKSSNSNLKSANQNGETVLKGVDSDNRLDMELNGVQETSAGFVKDDPRESDVDVTAPKDRQENEQNGLSKVDAQQTLVDLASVGPDVVQGKEEVVSAGFESKPCGATEKIENETSSDQLNGFSSLKRDRDSTQNDVQIGCAALSTKNLDSESSCTQTSFSLDGNNESDMCNNTGNIDNVIPKDQSLASEGAVDLAGEILVKRNNETMPVNSGVIANEDNESVRQNHRGSGSIVKVEEEIHIIGSDLQNEVNYSSKIEGMELNDHTVSKIDGKSGSTLGDNSNPDGENSSTGRPQGTVESSIHELPDATLSGMDPAEATGLQTCDDHLIVADKAHEDSILEEARIIEAKRKRISELSVGTLPMENRRKSRWDFVLEEMAWLANDFAQERLWKITAASLISRQVALASQLRFEEQDLSRKQRKVAYTVAKAVMQFWHSVEVLVNSDNLNIGVKNCKFDLAESASDNLNKAAEAAKIEEPNLEASKNLEVNPGENLALAVKGYAVRFLKYNRMIVPCVQAEAPLTPDRMCDLGIQELSSEDQFTKESLFYTAPPGAMETYRKSIESYLIQYETTGSSMMQEDVDTSLYDVEELSQENVYDEDEGETSTYYLPGTFERSKSSNFTQKNRKHFIRTYTGRSYELGADLPYGHCTAGPQQSILIGKRPANNLNVGSIPTKRVRTASRPRVPSPFGAGATGNVQALNKTDASSGDTNSFQDDQSTLHGGSQIQKSLEGESVADFEKSLPFDSGEITKKPKKKKKAKHLNSTYEQRWQLDSSIQNEQRDNTKKRLESHHLESNGSSGLFAQHIAKKPKMMKQSLDNNFDNIIPMPGSIPSPVASQMSNMSNTNKFMKLIGGRDRGRKSKSLKMPAGQPGSGSPWSLFEDQALVVLVHDMGPNWELVSDAINSTLQFKCIFRKPKECKERHKILMDRTAGDGADSAEDSGSSQPYPSTLPGIPKGSARQLFQRLQGPMEEDTLKSHFEKIISIGHRQHYRKSQTDNQDLKQIAPVHNSHVAALSQVCPNNLNGGFLTPLDLCDTTASSPDVLSSGYPSPHSSSLSITNQGSVVLPATGANSSLQGSSSSMVLGSNMSSPSGPINASTRDGRYGVSRASLPVDEQQRPQQYNPMLAARNVQQSSLPVSGALQGTDRGVRMLPGVNGMGVMSAMNRGMPMSRPGFQGMASSSMLNPGSMLSSSMVGMPSPVTGHTGANSGQGNSMLRPREALHMMRPGQSPEHQRQMMVPELQMQGQGNSQSVPSFNGLSSNFSNQTAPPVPTYPVHAPQQHQMSTQQSHALHNSHHPHLQGPSHTTGPQHPAYARQRQQRMMQQQQQQHHQFSASNALMQHVQPQPQLPLSSSLQNNSQIQQTSQPVSLPSLTPSSPMPPMSSQLQQKHNMPPHGISRGPQTGVGGLNNQMGKQRQRQALQQQQQFQQSGRHHPQQRQQSQSQPQAKVLKGMGRGNMLMHPNFSVDPSHLNGISMTPGSQAAEKGEPVMHMMQGQGLYPGSGLNSVQPSRSVVPPPSSNQSQLQQKLMSGPSPSLKQLQKMASHSDSGNQGQVPSSPSGHALSASQQAVLPSAVMAANHHQQQQLHLQPHQKQVTQSQPSVQRVLQQNHRMNSDLPNNSQAEQPHADQRAMNNSSHTGTTTSMSQVCMESTNATPAVSSSSAPQWKAPEPLYDSGMQNPSTLLGSAEGSALEKSSRSNPIPPINQGLVQRQFSGGLPPHGHNVEEQWQQQPQLKQPLGVPPPSLQHQQEQQDESSQQQVQPNQQSPQQMQHLQSGQSSLYIRPTNS